jgi:hypothetical protein
MPRDVQVRVPQDSVLSHTLYSIYKWCTTNTWSLFAGDTCIYATDNKESYVLRKLQRGLSATETWYERWNIKFNEDKTQAIYFSHRLGPPEVYLTMNRRNIPCQSCKIQLSPVIFDKRIIWRLHTQITEAKAFMTFIRIYSLYKSERLSPTLT